MLCNLINVKHKWKFKTGSNVYTCTVKHVLRGHLWDKDKVVF